jgi:hypothetical protein
MLTAFHNFPMLGSLHRIVCFRSRFVRTVTPILRLLIPYDRDWHINHLLLTLPAFKEEIDDIILEGHLIKTFIKDLLSFSALLEKEVTFEPTEPYFGLTFRFMSQRKMIEVDGYVQYPVGTGAVLKFEMETDLTYIDQFINGLENMLKTFPAI